MNNYNASLNTQSKEITAQALELLLKTLNGYDVLSSDQYVLARKGGEFSTYTKQALLSSGSDKSKLWQIAMASAPVSEVDKIKNVIRNSRQISQPVKLAMEVTGAGAYTMLDELYNNGKYSEMFRSVCSCATPEQLGHCEKQVANTGIPELSEFVIVTENNLSKRQQSVRASQPRTRSSAATQRLI